MTYRVKGWNKFQHFKDRRPLWIKLYRDILDDVEWHDLDPLASKVLISCWLIASEYEGALPDTRTLAFRLRMPEKQVSSMLCKLGHWLVQDDSTMLADSYQPDNNLISDCYQDDALEKRRDREEKRREDLGSQARGTRLPSDWQPKEHRERSDELAKFRDYWTAIPGSKGVKLDWDATWRNWIRNARAPQLNLSTTVSREPVISREENLERMRRQLEEMHERQKD